MTKKITLATLALVALFCFSANAEPLKIKGVYNHSYHNDTDYTGGHDGPWSTYVGWNSTLGKAVFVVENGIYSMTVDGLTLTQPVKNPDVVIGDFYSNGQFTNNAMALWATNFNLMFGNSGSVMNPNDSVITTVMSRTGEEVEDSERFAVRKWNANTGDLLSSAYFHTSSNLESAGMCANPKNGLVYGLFYLTAQDLPEEIVNDPDFFGDTQDAGYCICTIDLSTMELTPITPGLYYENFVTFAINSEGRAFALTSGGAAGYEGEDGKMYDINGNLTGAQLYEFDLESGLMVGTPVEAVDPETGETFTEMVNPYSATGYCSQAKRQSACFSKKDPTKMYWNGYFNSGKGFNENGSWGNLPDSEWQTNGKYDTALYEVDITTGEATRIAKFDDRYTFSCMWVEEEDDEPQGIYGDVNRDGYVTSADVTALYDYLLNGVMTFYDTSDVNGDGVVTSADVTAVYDILLGGAAE